MSPPLQLKTLLTETLRRFPAAVACGALFALIACIAVYNPPERGQDLASLWTYLHILFIGCFWFIAVQLARESRPQMPPARIALAVALFLAVALYLYLRQDLTWFADLFLCISAVLFMFIAPYLGERGDALSIWTFDYRLVLRIAFTFLAALILYLGLAAITASADYLLGIRVSESGKIYFYCLVLVASFFSPLFAMNGIPTSFAEREEPYPRFLRILVCNLMIPLWFVYAAIVYAYIVKILFTAKLPDGGVALLTCIFALKGAVLYLAAYPLYLRGETLAFWLGKHGAKLLIAPLILLMVAIGTRVQQDGVTQDRYAVVLCLIWLIIFTAQWLKRHPNPFRFGLISAVALLLLASFGPWGVDSLSTESQLGRLEQVLERNHILADGKIVASGEPVSFADRKAASSIVDYLIASHKIGRIAPWFAVQHAGDFTESFSVNAYTEAQNIMRDMGMTYIWQYQREDNPVNAAFDPDNAITYSAPQGKAFTVAGYDYATQITEYAGTCSLSGHAITVPAAGDHKARTFSLNFLPVKGTVTLIDNAAKDKIDFPVASLFNKKDWEKTMNGTLGMEGQSGAVKARIVITNASGRFDKDGPALTSLSMLLLIHLK